MKKAIVLFISILIFSIISDSSGITSLDALQKKHNVLFQFPSGFNKIPVKSDAYDNESVNYVDYAVQNKDKGIEVRYYFSNAPAKGDVKQRSLMLLMVVIPNITQKDEYPDMTPIPAELLKQVNADFGMTGVMKIKEGATIYLENYKYFAVHSIVKKDRANLLQIVLFNNVDSYKDQAEEIIKSVRFKE